MRKAQILVRRGFMKTVNTKPQQKRLILLAVLIGVLVLLIAGYIVARVLIDKREDPNKVGSSKFELLEGEVMYLGTPLVYDAITSTNINVLSVNQRVNGILQTFTIARLAEYGNNFVFQFNNGKGSGDQLFLPTISFEDSYFDYSSLYSADAMVEGSAEMPKIMYVCNAVGMLYFDTRIPLSSDATERQKQLTKYGFDMDSPQISFDYTIVDEDGNPELDDDGNPKTAVKKITLGDKLVTDSAYYFRVSDREDYIYSTTNPYFEYALLSLESFIEARLTAAGIDADAAYGPKLTPDYKQWKSTVYSINDEGKYVSSADGTVSLDPWAIEEDTELVYGSVSAKSPIDYTAGIYESGDLDAGALVGDRINGYRPYPSSYEIFDISALKELDSFKYAYQNLLGKDMGKYGEGELYFSVLGDNLPLSFWDNNENKSLDSLTYNYTVIEIESVFDENGESRTAVANPEKVKIRYWYEIEGQPHQNNQNYYHAIIDLTDERFDESVRTALKNAPVGSVLDPLIEFSMTYTRDNGKAIEKTHKLIIKDVFRVYDSKGELQDTVEDDSIVSFRYLEEINGVPGDVQSFTLELGKVKSTVDESSSDPYENGYYKMFKDKLLGKPLELDQNILLSERKSYHQPLYSFTEYEVNSIDLLTKAELIVSFKFINTSKRDPFYAESVFENTMGAGSEFGIYAINSSTCEAVVDILGGVNSESTGADGYVGTETVATYIDAEIMEEYGLFANKIYFVSPRGIYSADYTEGDDRYTGVEYDWYETLDYTIYISDEVFDDEGKLCRYAASTLYNTVIKVNAEDFKFLDQSFIELWARRNMFMVNIKDVDRMEVDFNMSDLKGSYDVMFNHQYIYTSSTTGETWTDKSQVPEDTAADEKHVLTLAVRPIGDISTFTETKLSTGYGTYNKLEYGGVSGFVKFNSIYDNVSTSEELATLSMKEFMRLLFNTEYLGTVSKQEQEQAKAGAPLMSLKFSLNGTAYRYGYDFYRISDRRVVVSIYMIDPSGARIQETSYFYISTPAFKKIFSAFTTMLNGNQLVNDDFYID